MGSRWWWTACVLVLGCFSEPTSGTGDGGSTDATTGSTVQCPLGTRGCPCDGLTCDAGLACHGPSHMCYEPSCERGALDCPCAEGLCLAGLECIDDFCMQPTSSGESTTTSDPDPTATLTAATSDPTITDSTEPTTGIDPVDTGASDPSTSTTTGEPFDACLDCLKSDEVCTCDDACQLMGECVYNGGDPAFCCANGPPGHADSWDAFVDCAISESCSNTCGAEPPDCGS